MQKTKLHYLQAANQFIESIKFNPDIIGIVVAGGFLEDMIHKNSDVDLWVILKEECDYSERGVVWINDIEVEYFMHPPRILRKQFERECTRPISASILAHGRLAYQNSDEVAKIINEARLHLKAQLPPMRDSRIKIAKHKLDDRYKDLEDLVIVGDLFAAQLTKNEFIEYCISLFLKIHQLKRDKFKRIQPLLKSADHKFTQYIDECLQAKIQDLEKALILKSYVEELLGGPNPKDWKIRNEAKR